LNAPVIVRIARDSRLDAACDEGFAERVAPVDIGDRQATIAAAEGLVAVADTALQLLEVREDIGVAPAAVAILRPRIVVAALSAIVDVAVDRTGAAERLAARGVNAPASGPVAGLHVVEPIHALIVESLDETYGDMDVGVPVGWSRLEDAYIDRGILAEAVCEHRTG
jgi:hypothetical protein